MFEWCQKKIGYEDELVRYLQKHSHTTLLLNQSKSNRLMLKRDSHNLNTNWRCSTWQGWSIGTISKIVCSKWLVPTSWVWAWRYCQHISRIPPWRRPYGTIIQLWTKFLNNLLGQVYRQGLHFHLCLHNTLTLLFEHHFFQIFIFIYLRYLFPSCAINVLFAI